MGVDTLSCSAVPCKARPPRRVQQCTKQAVEGYTAEQHNTSKLMINHEHSDKSS